MSLHAYKRKRKFDTTPEPSGTLHTKGERLRFVVQKHHASHLHYDFRLEMKGTLKSWAVPKGPSLDPSDKRLAVMVEDHPLEYRTFEGVIPEGNYGAGEVIIWDEGTYEAVEGAGEAPLIKGLQKGDLKFILHGKKLKGEFALVRFGNEEKNWLLIKKRDAFVGKDVVNQDESVKSGKRISELAAAIPKKKTNTRVLERLIKKGKKARMPHKITPMLAELIDAPFDSAEWGYEIKWDGYRAVAEVRAGAVELYSRNGHSYNKKYEVIVSDLVQIPHTVVLDGEIVAVDSLGRSQFQHLQEYHPHSELRLLYYVFDLLYIDGYDLRDVALRDRKSILEKILPTTQHVQYSDHIVGHGLALFELAQKKNAEGIIAKRLASRYLSKRSNNWRKIKHLHTEEAVIAGFTAPRGKRKGFGALVLGMYTPTGELQYIGHTGGGFDEATLAAVYAALKSRVAITCPFAKPPSTNAPVTWVKPQLVAQVQFSEWTKDGVLRVPIFLGLREDKDPKEVLLPQSLTTASGATNLDKVFWPAEGYTKGDLISYYEKISPTILPYLIDRPESLNRHPNGIDGESFFQKDMIHPPSFLKTVTIHAESENKDVHWLLCNDKQTLLYMANLGCIEINPWISRYQTQALPDFLLLDLDPDKREFKEVIAVALEIKKILDAVRIEGFVKTSGKRGLHIVIPLHAKYTYEQSRTFAELLATIISQQLPEMTSIERGPEKRKGKIYIDFLQNRIGQTMAAPYCVRPVAHAPVSTPLLWNELTPNLHPLDFTIKTIFKRLEKMDDPWKELLSHRGINMARSLEALVKLQKTFQ